MVMFDLITWKRFCFCVMVCVTGWYGKVGSRSSQGIYGMRPGAALVSDRASSKENQTGQTEPVRDAGGASVIID